MFFLLLATITVPLGSPDGWHHLSFGGLTPNTVHYGAEGIRIEVRRSSSPLFRPFPSTLAVRRLSASGRATGVPSLSDGAEGDGRNDDYTLRVGLAVEGRDSLGFFQRLFAPSWLKRLIELAPDPRIDRVSFLCLAQRREPGSRRRHPRSRYVEEDVAARVTGPGPFAIDHRFEPALRSLGLWVHADGDDTRSEFDVAIQSIGIETDETP